MFLYLLEIMIDIKRFLQQCLWLFLFHWWEIECHALNFNMIYSKYLGNEKRMWGLKWGKGRDEEEGVKDVNKKSRADKSAAYSSSSTIDFIIY